MDEGDDVVDVVIIGAGFTGLSAARELTKLQASVRIVDAYADHVGGRVYSYDPALSSDPALRFDHGAEYVGDRQNEVMALIRELLPEDALVNGAELRRPYPHEVMVLGRERYCFDKNQALLGIDGIPPQLGVVGAIGVVALLAELTLLEWSIDVVEPWRSPPGLLALDQITIEEWLAPKWWASAAVKDLLRISVEALFSAELHDISPFYLLWYTACNDGFLNAINDGAGGPQQYWLRCGAGRLAERFAEPVAERIELGVRVQRIDLRGEDVHVHTDRGVLRAKRVLVATSPVAAGRIEYEPAPPPARRALMDAPMGKTVKCQVFYRSRWWHESRGRAYDGYAGGAAYPLLWVMDNSPPDAERSGTYVLMTFTVGDQVDALGADPGQERIERFVTAALRDLFDDDRALRGSSEFLRLVAYGWTASEPFAFGGPNTFMRPGMLTGEPGKAMNEPWDDKVFFASAENARELRPRSRSSRWDALARVREPAYEREARRSSPSPPYTTRYSDHRKSLGYIDGALVSGRYVAHQIARTLGRDHGLSLDAEREDDVEPGPRTILESMLARGLAAPASGQSLAGITRLAALVAERLRRDRGEAEDGRPNLADTAAALEVELRAMLGREPPRPR